MRYYFDVKEISYGTLEVEAASEEEAISVAETQYMRGKTEWLYGRFILGDAKCAQDRNGDAR